MEFKELSVQFTNNAEEEIQGLVNTFKLVKIIENLQEDERIPDEFRGMVSELVVQLSDMFSINLPDVGTDPEVALRAISRDINLSRILRERGIFRLYQFVRQRNDDGVLLFMTLLNPDDDNRPFATQEDFLGWFCAGAHITRALVFQRLATIERLLTLGFTLEDSFQVLLMGGPSVIYDTLKSIGDWKKGDLLSVNPGIALRVTKSIAPDQLDEIRDIADNPDFEHADNLVEAIKPIFAELITQVAAHDSAKDAMKYVNHDILLKPELEYSWDEDNDTLIIEYIKKKYDPDRDEVYQEKPVKVTMVADINFPLPDEVRSDLIKRLPIKNRRFLDRY